MPTKNLPDGAQEVFRGKEAVADEAADEANTGRQTFRGPTEGRPKNATAHSEKNAWISEETWRLVDKRVSARRDPRKGQALKR